jgi:hypothetical protein
VRPSRKILSLLLKIAVSGTILFALFQKMDIGRFRQIVLSMDPRFFGVGVLLYTAAQVLSSYRWYRLLPVAGLRVSFPRLVSLYAMGMFFNNFLPTAIGGDAVKAYYLYKMSGEGGKGVASIFMDRYMGFFALVVISSVSLAAGYSYLDPAVVVLILLLAAVFFSGSLFLWVEGFHAWFLRWIVQVRVLRINDRLTSLYEAVMVFKGTPGVLTIAFGISLGIQTLGILAVFTLSKGFAFPVPLGYFFLFLPLAVAISMIPFSLAGLGLREGAFIYLFGKAGLDSAQAISLSLSWFAVQVLVSLAGGVVYLSRGHDNPRSGGSASVSQRPLG